MAPPTSPNDVATDRPARGTALVLGAGGGRGAAVAAALAARGWAVAMHAYSSFAASRAAAAAIVSAGGRALAVTADLRDEGAVRTLVHRVADQFGRIDAVVACTGLRRPPTAEPITAADLRARLDVGCVGPLVAAIEAADLMAGQAEGGTIVLVGDIQAERPEPGQLGRAVAGGATAAAARALAVGFADRRLALRTHLLQPPDDLPPDRVAAAVLALLEQP